MKQNQFMAEAIRQARLAAELDEVPIGAVIVENDQIIAAAHNLNISSQDPTAHAEIAALRQAAKIKNSHRLDNCDLYVTLEPCAMCAAAISLARIRRVYFAAEDKKFGAVENGVRVFNGASCHHKPEVYSGIFEEEAKEILRGFFKGKR